MTYHTICNKYDCTHYSDKGAQTRCQMQCIHNIEGCGDHYSPKGKEKESLQHYVVTHMKVDDKGLICGETIWSKVVLAENAKQAAFIIFKELLLKYEKELFNKYYSDTVEEEYGMLRDVLKDHNRQVLLYTSDGQWLEEYSCHMFWLGG